MLISDTGQRFYLQEYFLSQSSTLSFNELLIVSITSCGIDALASDQHNVRRAITSSSHPTIIALSILQLKLFANPHTLACHGPAFQPTGTIEPSWLGDWMVLVRNHILKCGQNRTYPNITPVIAGLFNNSRRPFVQSSRLLRKLCNATENNKFHQKS